MVTNYKDGIPESGMDESSSMTANHCPSLQIAQRTPGCSAKHINKFISNHFVVPL